MVSSGMSKVKEQIVPFHRAAVGEREAQAAADVVRSGWITMGSRTIEFEEKFARYVGAKHAIGVCSGTAGLGRGAGADNNIYRQRGSGGLLQSEAGAGGC